MITIKIKIVTEISIMISLKTHIMDNLIVIVIKFLYIYKQIKRIG